MSQITLNCYFHFTLTGGHLLETEIKKDWITISLNVLLNINGRIKVNAVPLIFDVSSVSDVILQ